jgi:hypothetical protein
MRSSDFFNCFVAISLAYDMNSLGYKNSWYDVEDDPLDGKEIDVSWSIP